MEELAYVAVKVVKGVAGLAYAFGDALAGLSGPDTSKRKPEPAEDEAVGQR